MLCSLSGGAPPAAAAACVCYGDIAAVLVWYIAQQLYSERSLAPTLLCSIQYSCSTNAFEVDAGGVLYNIIIFVLYSTLLYFPSRQRLARSLCCPQQRSSGKWQPSLSIRTPLPPPPSPQHTLLTAVAQHPSTGSLLRSTVDTRSPRICFIKLLKSTQITSAPAAVPHRSAWHGTAHPRHTGTPSTGRTRRHFLLFLLIDPQR